MKSSSRTWANLHKVNWKLYPSRWWVILLFSLFCMQQSLVWITFSVIAKQTIQFYNTTPKVIHLLTALGPLIYIPLAPIASWLIDTKGLRNITTWGCFIDLIGVGIRCFATNEATFYFIIIGQCINATLGPLVLSAPPKISALWFGIDDRTFVTSILAMSNDLGIAIGFMYGFWITEPSQIPLLIYAQSAISLLLFIGVVLYFPDHPPTPPAPSADRTITNADMKACFRRMRRSPSFFVIILLGGMSQGLYYGWSGLLDYSFNSIKHTTNEVSWIGFITTLSGVISGIMLGKISDKYPKHFKATLISFFFGAGISFVCFALQVSGWVVLPFNFWSILCSAILASIFINSTQGIYYEMCVELTYPVPEATSAGVLMIIVNFWQLIFIYVTNYMDSLAINLITASCMFLFGIILCFLKEEYKRYDLDSAFIF